MRKLISEILGFLSFRGNNQESQQKKSDVASFINFPLFLENSSRTRVIISHNKSFKCCLSRLPRTANVWREMRSNAAGKKVSNLTGISVLLLRFEFDDESLPEQDRSLIGCRAAGIFFYKPNKNKFHFTVLKTVGGRKCF